MPLSLATLSMVASPVSMPEGLKILERDDYRCQYCGLDGRASFENALVMRVDFVHPRARKGKKDPGNLVACCTPCNTIKGTQGLRQLRRSQNLRAKASRRLAQGLAIQNRPSVFQTRNRIGALHICTTRPVERRSFGGPRQSLSSTNQLQTFRGDVVQASALRTFSVQWGPIGASIQLRILSSRRIGGKTHW